jgi:glycosyltransferase involved in cell wall biosynthesis
MTSLVVTRWRPDHPTSGAALRIWQNIQALARLGPVDVLTVGLDDGGGTVAGVRSWTSLSLRRRTRWDQLKTRCWLLRPGVHHSIDAFHAGAVARRVCAQIADRRYDVAVIEGIALASYIPYLTRTGARIVFDAHNVESLLLGDALRASAPAGTVRRLKNWVVMRRIQAAERRAVRRSHLVWACSAPDAQQIERLFGGPPVSVVPNALDVDAYRGAPLADADWSRQSITVLYTGLFSYSPNADAAMALVQEVLPRLRASGRDARLMLVGRDPTAAMLAAARRDPSVVVTGAVESVVPYLHAPCVVAVPLRLGSGTRLKILEAFAAGRPVISTAKGAEGLDAIDGTHLLVRDDPDGFAGAIVDLWHDADLRRQLCQHATALVRAQYSWSVAADRIAQSLTASVSDHAHRQSELRRVPGHNQSSAHHEA